MMVLPWPPSALSPNSRCHWRAKARITSLYRADCYMIALISGLKVQEGDRLCLRFCPPDKRRRDIDNMLASCKGLIDAVAQASGIDDSTFRFGVERGQPVAGGRVEITIERADS